MTNEVINCFIVGSTNAIPVYVVTQGTDWARYFEFFANGFGYGIWTGVLWLLIFAIRKALAPSRFGTDG